MHVECLMTLAQIYCDQVKHENKAGKYPTMSAYGYVGLDYWRLRHLIDNRYLVEISDDLWVTAKGRDALYNENLNVDALEEMCDECAEFRVTSYEGVCVDCSGGLGRVPSAYVETGPDGLLRACMYEWVDGGYSEIKEGETGR